LTSWKQCPAVITHWGAINAPEQALDRVVPSGFGMFVMVNFTANGNAPGGALVPFATASAGAAATTPAAMKAAATATA
jgi:hypothetical protein